MRNIIKYITMVICSVALTVITIILINYGYNEISFTYPKIKNTVIDIATKVYREFYSVHIQSINHAKFEEKLHSSLSFAEDAVVKIRFVQDTDPDGCTSDRMACGTGVVIYADHGKSYILTNKHIGGSSTYCGQKVFTQNRFDPVPSSTIAVSDKTDLALLQVNTPLVATNIASKELDIGESAMVVGAPYCQDWVLDTGYTSRKSLNVLGSWAHRLALHTYPGNSGSPVYDNDGSVTGLIYAGHRGIPSMGFYIPLESIQDFLSSINFPEVEPATYEKPKVIDIPPIILNKKESKYYHPIYKD